MTTIACDRHEMAADSQVTDGTATFGVVKVHKIGEWIIGYAGSLSHAEHLLEFLRDCQSKGTSPLTALRMYAGVKAEDQTILVEEVELILLSKSGIYLYEGIGVPCKMRGRSYTALGSGSQAAMALMEVGYSPGEAVKVTRKIDLYTGGPVTVKRLEKAAKRKKR